MPTGLGFRTHPDRGSPAARALVLFAILLAACDGPPPALQVGPIRYSEQDLAALDTQGLTLLPRVTAFGVAIAEDAIDGIIAPNVERDLRSLTIQHLALELAADVEGVDDDELRQIYSDHPRYELVVRHLVVLSERWRPAEHRDSARARAEEALARVRAGEPFADVAALYSDEPGAGARGGLLQPGREGSWVPEFWEAASALPEGGISPVVETEFGYHVMKLEERRPIPFEEVREEVLEDVMSLPRALGQAGSWATAPVAAGAVDTAALDAWRTGAASNTALVHWPDTLGIPALSGGELSDYVRTLPEAARPPHPLSLDEALGLVGSAARTHVMHAEAERRGIEPSELERAAIRERWDRRIERWSSSLGFRKGVTEEDVKQNALQAAETVRQNAAIARAELAELEPVLLEAYPVRWAAADTAAGTVR